MNSLTNKNIILGVSGSISAYKAPDIVRRLQDLGAQVKVILTEGGAKFITELSLQSISKNKVHYNLWDKDAELSMGHIELAKWADAVLIAPASANTIANIALGKANDLLSSVILANDATLLIAPAMNLKMYQSHALQDNLLTLISRHAIIIKPESGEQACGDIGIGRLAEPLSIAKQVAKQFISTKLTGKKVLITLGATIEAIDPVRFISNHSSGKMGMALVNACIEMGASVTCIYGNITTTLNAKSNNMPIISAQQMYTKVMNNIVGQDIFIACAAVSDFSVKNSKNQKIKKDGKNLILELIPNKDILADVCKLGEKPICMGFAAETQNTLKKAQKKLKNKGCDVIILNDVSNADFGFNVDENEVVFLSQNLNKKIAKNSKQKVAKKILAIFIKEYL
ncbi:phosphopantothenoylcysteine decarboxylase/phosphopantothenate-cysteine ligase [Abyssogena phaseoliformis symbiont OG214]|uniref:bifunctional phosphopantothenoylcysteine decarboxylase/phosphopantothenate--cysteine ligase CoaBC n=1 Tax=Abyssogena phaseoliformis symbiont TaxID=596095 RepID=UPI0019166E89|nr:bifunctional phosphopantothenoylcysteine decarboxylase/phosphopantothenate--cysteine ligase CoaBC [Abyssogena phaseoliformis symbiont]BBB22933.1 phosphopantothenoylcysteine decarboxylase/phosphopantothenate-cysteine ligase [Abyssogena phaseoliformis symbiont OG214]